MANRASTAPNSVREQRARETLKQIDQCLDIRWYWTAVHEDDVNDEIISWEGRYAIIMYLSPNDPELAIARQNGTEDPFTILGWYTQDMNRAESLPLPCDEIEPKLRIFLGRQDGNVRTHTDRLRELQLLGDIQEQKQRDDILDESVQNALEKRRQIMNIPYVGAYTSRRS